MRTFAFAVTVILLIVGCSSTVNPNTAGELARRQRAVQDCILAGGHPVLGPNQQILCK